ncbi:hypothetical protein JXO52_02355 [bacterium]|nr:hypothetical protein [bacterium]
MKRIPVIIAIVLVMAGSAAAMEYSIVHEDSIDVITIKKSGFMNNEEIVISFRSSDHSIVSVMDKGEPVPEEKWHEYRSLLWSYLELRNVEELRPKIEKIRQQLLKTRHLREDEIERMVMTERKLDSLRARLERTQTRNADRLLEEALRMEERLAEVRERHLEAAMTYERLEAFLDRLAEEDIISDTGEFEIKFKDGSCEVNGKKVSKDISDRIKDLYADTVGKTIDEEKFTIKKQK